MAAADWEAELDSLDLAAQQRRRSEKWSAYPPEVLPAWIAEMDFPLAAPIRRVLHEAVDRGDTGYAPYRPRALAEAFTGFAARWFGWTVDPGDVTAVPDANVGIAETLRVLTGPGDGVVMHTPTYPPFYAMLDDIGRRPVSAPLTGGEQGWEIDLAALDAAFAEGARAYLLINPHNPTGRVLTRTELEAVTSLAERHRVPIIADEIHAPLVLPGATHIPLTTLGGWAAERGVVFTAPSKAFNTPGLKCALAVAGSPSMRDALARLPANLPYQVSLLGVLAGEAAFTQGDGWLESVRQRLAANRTLLGELLNRRLPEVGWIPQQASYLAWLDFRKLGLGDEPAARLAEHAGVGLSRGLDFGEAGRGHARLNVGTSGALVEESVRRIAAAARS